MGFLDRFRKRKPTSDQLERLSRITNHQQREVLLKAIELDEEIPEYAWDPLPEDLDAIATYRHSQDHLRSSGETVEDIVPRGPLTPPRRARNMAGAPDVGPGLIESLFRSSAIDATWSIREPRGFTWWGHRLAQRVWAEPARESDGVSVVRLQAETDVLRDVPNTRDVAERLAVFNQHASMSAFVWDPKRASVNLCCVADAHPETAELMKTLFGIACALQVADAHIKVDALAQLLGGHHALSDHPKSGRRAHPDEMLFVIEQAFAPQGAGPAPFSDHDFAAASHSRVVPWLESEAAGPYLRGLLRSQEHPSGTGILRMSAESRHPQLGSGLLALLTIPAEVERDILLAVCHELNLIEATTTTARSSFFGAWCPNQELPSALAFASFIPSMACRAGLVEVIAASMAARAAWARDLIEAATMELDTARATSADHHIPQHVLIRSIAQTLAWKASPALD